MKKLITFCSLLLFVCASQAFAAAPTAEQLERLTKALGFPEQLEAQKAVVAKQTKDQTEQYIQAMAASVPDISKDMEKAIKDEQNSFLTKINDAYDTKAMAHTYGQMLGTQLSAEDVDQILAFFESKIGKKLTKANTEITGPWTEQFMTKYNQKVATYTQEFGEALIQKLMSLQQQQRK